MRRVAVLVSGEGRNLQALLDARASGRVPAEFVGVLSNRPGVTALARAERHGVPTTVIDHRAYPDRAAFDAELDQRLRQWRPDWVLLAGFMRILTPGFVDAWRGRLLNIHPSLLPRHPGLKTHERVLAAGEREHGASVHFVTPALDGGPVLIQGQFTVRPEDDAARLAERVMTEIETRIYPQALRWCLDGRASLAESGAICFDGAPLPTPKTLADLEEGF